MTPDVATAPGLTSGQPPPEPEFLRHAQLMGHDLQQILQPGGDQRASLIPDLDTYRAMLGSSVDQRRKRSGSFFTPPVLRRARLGQGLHDRGEAAIFAAHDLSEDDRRALAIHLPLHMKTQSVAQITVPAGQHWDVSVRGDAVWGLDLMEEVYCTLNIGTLVLEPGAAIVVRGNVFVMICQHLVVQEPSGPFQIGILPTPHSVDYGSGPMRGDNGPSGQDGQPGSRGRPLQTVETFIGPRLAQRGIPGQLDGEPGQAGGAGARGLPGRNGGMCKLAEITLRRLTGSVTVLAQAGQGGDGGDGGHGGTGGDGGAALPGATLLDATIPPGSPGNGGRGGDGGDGGAAGNGGLASNIYITVPGDAVARVTRQAFDSRPGRPGQGGKGGHGGQPGAAVVGGQTAQPGSRGRDGTLGPPGRSRPAPWIFLNETPPDAADAAQTTPDPE